MSISAKQLITQHSLSRGRELLKHHMLPAGIMQVTVLAMQLVRVPTLNSPLVIDIDPRRVYADDTMIDLSGLGAVAVAINLTNLKRMAKLIEGDDLEGPYTGKWLTFGFSLKNNPQAKGPLADDAEVMGADFLSVHDGPPVPLVQPPPPVAEVPAVLPAKKGKLQ